VQLRLLPLYRQLAFAPSFWSFTFPWSAVVTDALRWIGLERPAAAAILAGVALGGLSALVGGIALRSLIALRRGTFLPARPATIPAAGRAPIPGPGPTVLDAQLKGR